MKWVPLLGDCSRPEYRIESYLSVTCEAEEFSVKVDNTGMKTHPDPRIVYVDRVDGSIIVSFHDGKSALYSAALLYATLPQARVITDQLDGDFGVE